MTDQEFETEIAAHYRDLVKMAKARLRSRRLPLDLAEDVVHDVVARAWSYREQLTGRELARSYFAVATLNRVQDLIAEHFSRDRATAAYAHEARAEYDLADSHEENYTAQLATLDRLLPEIPDERGRTALYLMVRWGVSLTDAAEIMGVDPENLRKREYTRALDWLREQLVPAP